MYNSYFFFCLVCRLPTVCMFVSALALMGFLFAVAWTAWPTAVLVMSFVAGFLLTSQFLVFGIHRFVGLMVWLVRGCWGTLIARRSPAPPQTPPQPPSHPHSKTPQHDSNPARQPQRPSVDARIEMPLPVRSPASNGSAVPRMEMVWTEQVSLTVKLLYSGRCPDLLVPINSTTGAVPTDTLPRGSTFCISTHAHLSGHPSSLSIPLVFEDDHRILLECVAAAAHTPGLPRHTRSKSSANFSVVPPLAPSWRCASLRSR